MTGTFLFIAAFLACTVEAVEATTVVLAVGLTRGWTSAFRGVFAGVIILAAFVGALAPVLSHISLNPPRLVVGGLLLIFGLGWLRKAILRASGFKAMHDESDIYAHQLDAARKASGDRRGWMGGDSYAFTLAFQAVLLEGLEVAFIVVTFGVNAGQVPLAALAALAAIVATVIVAFVVRGPLAKVPENAIKFAVGVLLASFGTFWGAEGAGAHWPGKDTSLLVIIPVIAVLSMGLVSLLRTLHRPAITSTTAEAVA